MVFIVIAAMLAGALVLTGLEWVVKRARKRKRKTLWKQALGRIDRKGTGKVAFSYVKVRPLPEDDKE